MDIQNLLLSYNGRIRRMHFWLGGLGLGVVAGILFSIISMLLGPKVSDGALTAGSPLFMPLLGIVYIAMLYGSFAISVKRMHDTDRSGWWVLVPVFNIIVCGFLPGTAGPNKFGPDPKAGTAPAAAPAA
ncbi:MAG TPA: DUF805 domain-containing protein [Caulobacteraceae bacterium]|jgi:uncharacterized membrane protein YhaH (DUF805 family)